MINEHHFSEICRFQTGLGAGSRTTGTWRDRHTRHRVSSLPRLSLTKPESTEGRVSRRCPKPQREPWSSPPAAARRPRPKCSGCRRDKQPSPPLGVQATGLGGRPPWGPCSHTHTPGGAHAASPGAASPARQDGPAPGAGSPRAAGVSLTRHRVPLPPGRGPPRAPSQRPRTLRGACGHGEPPRAVLGTPPAQGAAQHVTSRCLRLELHSCTAAVTPSPMSAPQAAGTLFLSAGAHYAPQNSCVELLPSVPPSVADLDTECGRRARKPRSHGRPGPA